MTYDELVDRLAAAFWKGENEAINFNAHPWDADPGRRRMLVGGARACLAELEACGIRVPHKEQ